MAAPIKPKYDEQTMKPRSVRGINEYTAAEARRHRFLHPASPLALIPETFDVMEHVSPQAVASITRSFLIAKTSHNGWKSYQRVGRFDKRRAAGATRLEQDVFQRKTGRSTTKVRCSVLIDASGSMSDSGTARIPSPLEQAGDKRRKIETASAVAASIFGATIARALGKVPTVDLDVFQHSAGTDGSLYLKYRWAKGTPVQVFNEVASNDRPGGGNADGHALYAITDRMLKELKRDERGVIMVVSDGMPSVYAAINGQPAAWGPNTIRQAGQALKDAVAYARSKGIEVIAVAVDGSDQSTFYGKDGVIPFKGDWSVLGTELAKHIGRALAARR